LTITSVLSEKHWHAQLRVMTTRSPPPN